MPTSSLPMDFTSHRPKSKASSRSHVAACGRHFSPWAARLPWTRRLCSLLTMTLGTAAVKAAPLSRSIRCDCGRRGSRSRWYTDPTSPSPNERSLTNALSGSGNAYCSANAPRSANSGQFRRRNSKLTDRIADTFPIYGRRGCRLAYVSRPGHASRKPFLQSFLPHRFPRLNPSTLTSFHGRPGRKRASGARPGWHRSSS